MSLGQTRRPVKKLISVSFNQDAACFSIALTDGFRVFTTEPFSESYRRSFDAGGVAIAEMLFRSNLVALVGGGPCPKYPPNKVMIWDDHQQRAIGELVFKTPVRSVCLRNNRIAVALEQKVFLYDIENLRSLHSIETTPNPEGLLALSLSEEATVLACPGLHSGKVRIELTDTKRPKVIAAHTSPLSALALSHNGKYVATTSEKGTLIRVFSTFDGTKVRELRRGTDTARIYSLAFSIPTTTTTAGGGGSGSSGGGSSGSGALGHDGLPEWLAVSSDKGTVHVFNLTGKVSASSNGEELGEQLEEKKVGGGGSGGGGGFRNWQKFVPNKVGGAYLASERSWVQYRLPDNHKCIVAFGNEPGILLIASVTGAFFRVAFDTVDKKVPCALLDYNLFMEEEE